MASIATRVGRRIGAAPAAGARPAAPARVPAPAPFRRRVVFEELESRLLMSADLNPLATDTLLAGPAASGAEFRAIATPSEAVVISAEPAATRRHAELAFVDAGTPDHDRLVAGMRETALGAGRELEMVLIGRDDDGLRVITETLAARAGLDAVHIVSHGEAGMVQLGRARLDVVTLAAHATQIKAWGEALNAQADLLIYGCDVAATAEGRALVDALARLTGADVAASEDPTGSVELGGNWTLEYRSGAIEAAPLGADGWRGLLAETVWMAHTPAFSVLDDTGYELKSDQSWGERFRLTGGGPSTTYDVNRVDLVLSRASDAPTQTITVSLRESWTGPDLASASIPSASLTTAEQWYEFRFATTLTLNKNQEYFIRVATNGLEKVYLGVDPGSSGGNDVLINKDGAQENGKDAAYRVVFDTAAPPSAADDLYVMDEDTTLAVAAAAGVLVNDSDPDTPAASLSALLVTGPSNGTLALGANGAFVYTPRADFYGVDTFTYRVSDGALTSNMATVTITVNNVADHVLVVDTTADSVDGDVSSIDALLMTRGADGRISLREAILAANATANAGAPDRIHFAIPGAGTHAIGVTSALPAITDAVVIDATTEPGYAGLPLIELNGGGIAASGLHVTAGGSTVRGLAIGGFNGHGIWLQGGSGNVIAANHIGTETSGTAVRTNNGSGVFVDGSANNLIGGTAAADRNVLSGNARQGVHVTGAGSAGNAIRGNYIGLGADGVSGLGNFQAGVRVDGGASGTTIGGVAAGSGNVISGNRANGIEVRGAGTSNTVVQGNRIGTDATGSAAAGNWSNGIDVGGGATSTSIGGAASGAGNVISGNRQSGIRVSGADTTGVAIGANLVGLNAAGTAALGNGEYGVQLSATGTVLGGLTAAERNVISGNGIGGVYVSGGSGNVIRGNYIGTDATGGSAIGNRGDGVWIDGGANATVGGTVAGAGNLISGNASSGVATSGSAAGTVIAGNLIGLNADGTAALGNSRHGVQLGAAGAATVGGTVPEAANVIAFNGLAGVAATGVAPHGVLGNSIYDNGGLGIDLGGDGVTLGGQPQLVSALSDGTVAGTLASAANTTYRIELFASPAPDPSGYGEGRRYLGFVALTTDASGNAAFVASVAAMASGEFVTATATNVATGSTSEFSAAVVAIKPNAAPSGADAFVSATEDVPYVFTLADFPFSDPDAGDTLSAVRIDTLPAAGVLRLSGVDVVAGQLVMAGDLIAGRFAFEGAPDAHGTPYATFDFTVRDSGTPAAFAATPSTMTVSVAAVNDAPLRIAGAVANVVVAEDSGTTSLGLGALGYSPGPANESEQSLTYSVTTVPPAALGEVVLADGVTVVSAGSSYTLAELRGMQFRTAADAHGAPAAFGWTVRDDGGTANGGADTLAESLTISVTPVNDAPVAVDDDYTIAEDTALVIVAANLALNDTDVDGDALTVTGVGGAVNGTVSLVAGTITFTPSVDYHGPASFTYTVSDGNGGSATGTVNVAVTPVNDAPAAMPDAYSVAEDGTLSVAAPAGVLANDSDVEGDGLSALLVAGPSFGILTLNADGSFLYTPDADFHGSDSFTYRASDGAAASAPVTVTITVTPVNDAPTSGAGTVATAAPLAYTFAVADFPFADVDGDALERIRVTSLPAFGVLLLDGAPVAAGDEIPASVIAAGRLSYTPPADLTAAMVVQFGFLVSDGAAFAAAGGTMTIGIAPLAVAETPSVPPDHPGDAPPGVPVDGSGGTPPPQAADAGFAPATPAAERRPDTTSGAPSSGLAGAGDQPTSGGGRGGAAASEAGAGTEGAAAAAETVSTVAAAGLSSPAASGALTLGSRDGGLGAVGVNDGSAHELEIEAQARAIEAIAAPEFLRHLDELREAQQAEAAIEMRVAGSVLAVSSGLSVGYVLWLLRGGVLLSSLLTSLPAWRLVDPLPVLGRIGGRADEGDDDSLEEMVETADEATAQEAANRGRRKS